MNGSYSVPIGSSRSPLIECDRPSADSRMNRFISAMPSSMCWPFGENSQLKVEGMRSLLNVSAMLSRANRPRRFTHGPRLVETVTSGEVVTMRSASGVFSRASSLSSAPKPNCVDISGWIVTASSAGTAICGAFSRRAPPGANGTCRGTPAPARAWRAGLRTGPTRGRRGCPSPARKVSICAGVIRPAWLSLWPAIGRPKPFTV